MPSKPAHDAWLAATLRSIGDPIFVTDPESRLVWMNPSAESLTGADLGEAKGHPLVDILGLYDEDTGHPAVSPVYRVCDPKEPEAAPVSYILRRAGKTDTPIEVSCFQNTATPGESGSILVCRDLSASRLRENLRVRAERLDAIAGMAAGIAHDFNNHLTVIQGYADELRRVPGVGDRTPVQEIAQTAIAAVSMTRSLMGVARRSSSHPEVLVLSDLVAEMGGAIGRLLGSTRTLLLTADPGKAKVQADRTLLKQVLTTLATFARDTKPSGGEFAIEPGSMEILDSRQAPGWNRVGSYARLRITVSGVEFEPLSLARIFEPACTSKAMAYTSGIGLAQVHGIVTQCGGYIHAAPAEGGGVAFEILLPRVYQFQALAGESQPAVPHGDDAPLTVLLVEDDDSVRRIVHNYMERAGFNLLEAANAEEASDLAEVYEEPIHVLVTDVVLPGMSGRELADKLKAVRPQLKVLLVSGFPRNTLVHTGAADEHRFLAKPFTANQLLECVRSLMQDEVPAQTL